VFLSDDNLVGLRVPPGESALIPLEVVNRLQQQLTGAVIEATHRGAEK
jgi:hypothetical protein